MVSTISSPANPRWGRLQPRHRPLRPRRRDGQEHEAEQPAQPACNGRLRAGRELLQQDLRGESVDQLAAAPRSIPLRAAAARRRRGERLVDPLWARPVAASFSAIAAVTPGGAPRCPSRRLGSPSLEIRKPPRRSPGGDLGESLLVASPLDGAERRVAIGPWNPEIARPMRRSPEIDPQRTHRLLSPGAEGLSTSPPPCASIAARSQSSSSLPGDVE
jgi:hypothetical protein